MTRDDIIQMLRDYRVVQANIERLKIEIADIEHRGIITRWIRADALSQLQSPQLTGMPQSGKISSPTERIALDTPKPMLMGGQDSPKELDSRQSELFALQRQARATEIMLACLYDKERFVVEQHLIAGLTWAETGSLHTDRYGMYMPERTGKRIQGDALDKIERLFA